MSTTSLGHLPGGRWSFDESVATVFEDMLARSIPQYEVMRQAVFDLGSSYVQPNTTILDLGCSRGDALAPFVSQFAQNNHFLGIEISPSMLPIARERFSNQLGQQVEILELDLRRSYPQVQASLTLSVLTLQFIPIEYRQHLVRNIFKHTLPGGALILIEKLLGATSEIDELLVRNYYALKAQNGYTTEEIERKRLSLEGVLVPVTAKWNEELLRMAGFTQIDCFWRFLNFAGWVAIRE